MGQHMEQGRVIHNLNKYLQWHNFPLRMSKEGICNGLATVYARYVLEGREEEFLHKLQYVGGKKATPEEESEISYFVMEILLSFLPEQFNKKLNQANSMQALTA